MDNELNKKLTGIYFGSFYNSHFLVYVSLYKNISSLFPQETESEPLENRVSMTAVLAQPSTDERTCPLLLPWSPDDSSAFEEQSVCC